MSGLKNSPFGKRLRASHQDTDDEAPRRNRPRINPIFGVASASTPSLDSTLSSRPTTSEGPESPIDTLPRIRDHSYGDRFVPSRDSGDMRTSYHLMDQGGPTTPSKNRIIPSESDALKGASNPSILRHATNVALRTSQCHFHFYPAYRGDTPIAPSFLVAHSSHTPTHCVNISRATNHSDT